MFENRPKGSKLVKRISYIYLALMILFIISVAIVGPYDAFIISAILYLILAVVLYLLSTKYADNKNTWIFVINCGIITFIRLLNIVGILFAVLLIIAANDMKKELE